MLLVRILKIFLYIGFNKNRCMQPLVRILIIIFLNMWFFGLSDFLIFFLNKD